MTYQVGELYHRVTFKREVSVDDGMGGSTTAWQDIAEVWAHVRPLTGRERQIAGEIAAVANYLIVIRYRDDLRENDKATWRGIDLNIRFIRDRGPRAAYLEIEADKGAGT